MSTPTRNKRPATVRQDIQVQSASAVPPLRAVDDDVDDEVDDHLVGPFLPAGRITRANPPRMMRAQS